MKKLYFKSIFIYLFLVVYSIIGSKNIDAGNSYQDFIAKGNFTEMTFLFLMGSIIETLIFNFLIIYLLKKIKFLQKNNILIIIIASVFFGLGHFSSYIFLVVTFIAGLCLNYNFLCYYNYTKNYKIGILSTFILHFLTNYTIYLLEYHF
jgi:hypothetical protein